MKRTLGWTMNIMLIWLLVLLCALFLLPRFGGWRFDTVLSGSMEPALPVGGVVAIKPVEPDDISAGDIIAFYLEETIVTHRVIEVINGQSEPSFTTKGDANEDADFTPVSASNVIGKVIFATPHLGYLTAFVKTRLGFMIAILLPGLALIAVELKNIWQVVLGGDKASPRPMTIGSPKAEEEAAAMEMARTADELIVTAKPVNQWPGSQYTKVSILSRACLIDKILITIAIIVLASIIMLAISFLEF